jgi:tetratricopeptide (TPR) repeat protein
MGKETSTAREARRVVAYCAFALAAIVATAVILQAPATVYGSRSAQQAGSLARETNAEAPEPPAAELVVRKLPLISLSDEARRHLERAFTLTARAQYTEARASCRALIRLTSPAVVAGCVAPIDGVTGRYEVARHHLESALTMAGSLEHQVWLYALLGELAFWNGDLARAEQALGSALALAPDQPELLALHVDLLLDTGRARQALNMLAGQGADDGVLLREMLAYQRLGLTEAARSAAHRLQQRFDGAHARGETVAVRDEARFYANLPGHEQRALDLARLSFGTQQDPWDARLLLEASLHAGRRKSAQPALDWLARSNCESPALHVLATQLSSEH